MITPPWDCVPGLSAGEAPHLVLVALRWLSMQPNVCGRCTAKNMPRPEEHDPNTELHGDAWLVAGWSMHSNIWLSNRLRSWARGLKKNRSKTSARRMLVPSGHWLRTTVVTCCNPRVGNLDKQGSWTRSWSPLNAYPKCPNSLHKKSG